MPEIDDDFDNRAYMERDYITEADLDILDPYDDLEPVPEFDEAWLLDD